MVQDGARIRIVQVFSINLKIECDCEYDQNGRVSVYDESSLMMNISNKSNKRYIWIECMITYRKYSGIYSFLHDNKRE